MSRIALIALAGLVTCGTALATDTPRVDQRQANQERREACQVAVVAPLSDDAVLLGAMRELVDAMFP